MNSITLIMDETRIQQLKKAYQAFLLEPVPYSVFRAKLNNVTITAYQSGKVVFQGRGAKEEAQRWVSKLPDHSIASEYTNDPTLLALTKKTIIGSDEVGNGSYFGALTVCAVYLPAEQQALIKELGVRDSKQLHDHQIHQIAQDIRHTLPFHLTIVNPEKYNQLTSTYNANAIKAKVHNFTLLKLLEKLTPIQQTELKAILIDQFTPEKNYFLHLKDEKIICQDRVYFAKQAESLHLAVACASIIARDAFIESLHRLGQPYHQTLPSGASAKVDAFGAKLVKEFGMKSLTKTAKLHFANTQKIQAMIQPGSK